MILWVYLKMTTTAKTQKVTISKDRDLDEFMPELGIMSLDYSFEYF